jgi:hypothetical protein
VLLPAHLFFVPNLSPERFSFSGTFPISRSFEMSFQTPTPPASLRIAQSELVSENEIRVDEDQLVEQIQSALGGTGYFPNVPCAVTIQVTPNGHVSLCGVVPSSYLKQRAQVAAMNVEGVNSLQNDLMVL